MNKKLIFRILGALASALMIVAVFVPFVSVKGYSSSLWETYQLSKALYLPIMIIVFGGIGVVFFALNIKTEFAYMSTGAVLFFVIMQTIEILDKGVFNTLSIGYYFLVVGAVLTGIMAFLMKMKQKNVIKNDTEDENNQQDVMLAQIDKLYDDQPTQEIAPIQAIDNVVAPIQPINSVQEEPLKVDQQPINPQVPLDSMSIQEEPQNINPVVINEVSQQSEIQDNITMEPNPVQPEVIEPVQQQSDVPIVENNINPVVQEFNTVETNENKVDQVNQQNINPVVQEFNMVEPPVENTQPTPAFNPVVQEFATQAMNQTDELMKQNDEVIEPIQQPNSPVEENNINPVVQEFTNPNAAIIQNSNESETDIFGQPINK